MVYARLTGGFKGSERHQSGNRKTVYFNDDEKKWPGEIKNGVLDFNLARKQALASIRRNKPTAGMEEIRKELFIRFYGEEFSPEDQEKILRQIGRMCEE